VSVGKQVKAALVARGRSQQWLADRLRWSKVRLSNIILGKQEPTESDIRVIAAAIRRSPGWLFKEDG